MHRGIEDLVAFVKSVLNAVTVMEIDIDDHHFFHSVTFLEIPSPKGDIVEKAEPHGLVRLCVMSGRPDARKASFPFPLRISSRRVKTPPRPGEPHRRTAPKPGCQGQRR